jgi:xanthine dehydrogenase YagT iron-sulfur-binding subunit
VCRIRGDYSLCVAMRTTPLGSFGPARVNREVKSDGTRVANHHPVKDGEGISPTSRRTFIKQATGLVGAVVVAKPWMSQAAEPPPIAASRGVNNLSLKVNGQVYQTSLETRVTLLDALRDHLYLTGTKKGCDHGTCGACTVHIDGKRALSCLTLAARAQNHEVTTIEGLANGETLHPVQQAFVDCDGFQCGFCTPGQIMSATACIHEGHVHDDGEIREWMSGNICRCAAYPNILDAIKQAAKATA